MKILVTGAAGSIGRALCPWLREMRHEVVETDVDTLDVTIPWAADHYIQGCDAVIHLAGFKQAPDGEVDPAAVARINITGTENIVKAAEAEGAFVILASTCKAADPETAYGASKLIAERIVLNAGGTVARFYNVREADGNVFRLWESLPESEPIPYTDCSRYFISMKQAVGLLARCLYLPSGRYTVDAGRSQHMASVAEDLYPDRECIEIPRRRGDRMVEPSWAWSAEDAEPVGGGVLRIRNRHDPLPDSDEQLAEMVC